MSYRVSDHTSAYSSLYHSVHYLLDDLDACIQRYTILGMSDQHIVDSMFDDRVQVAIENIVFSFIATRY